MIDYPVKRISINRGETLAYRETGRGDETVLLIHGNMSSSVHFQTTMERLEGKYKVYAIDLRGFGDSSYNKPLTELREYALDVLEFIKIKKLNNIHLVGWSAGGGVSMELSALAYDTDIIKDLVLLSSVGVEGIRDFDSMSKLSNYTSKVFKSVPNNITLKMPMDSIKFNIPSMESLNKIGEKNKEVFNKYAHENLWNMRIYNTNKPSKEDFEKYIAASLKQQNLKDMTKALKDFNITENDLEFVKASARIKLINIPILILHGEKDLVVKLSSAENTEVAFQGRAKLVEFKDCGHSLMTDSLDVMVNEIEKFWEMNKG